MTNLGNSVFVYGIDIGSEYSGYAYVSRHDITLKGPLTLSTPTWIGSPMWSHKCPTVILLDRNEEMVAFGYEAENKFVTIMEDDETNDYYYFKHFRDQIHQGKAGNQMIKDVRGKPLEALKVISQTIGYFKHHAMSRMKEHLNHPDTLLDDFYYFVLTVPTTWDDKEIDFWRKATIMAGIKENKLRIEFEQEAASVYILRTDLGESLVEKRIEAGEKYMVIDVGGLHIITY